MTIHPATSDITTDNAEEFRHRADRRALWRASGGSLLLHGLLLALLIGLWQVTPPEEIVLPPIAVKFEGSGAAGSPGGGGGKATMPGEEQGTAAKPAAAATPPPAPAVIPLKTSQAAPPPMPKPAPKVTHHPPPPKPSPTAVVQTPAAPAPAPAPAPATNQSVQTASVASAAGAGQGSEGADSAGNGNVGRSQGTIGSGTGSGSGDDYLDLLRRHLNRYKKYPEEAIKQKQEGTVLLGFNLAHDGTVTKAWIEQSSGNPLLDQAALTMMHDASPVPAVPERYWDKKGPIILPVDFKIGFFDKVLR